ncbi:MAG TPA: gluconate 2-dehydrogenase subunit 3 family protein [Pyrinomonadaceae bacterium]|nr:gluconate 2-dehydrogenase subunit 3 family protein [Pyrinomonadaceae bacterium]
MNSETLRAVVDCLIPPDDFPGAYEAGVCNYLDQLLQTDLAEHAEVFRSGIDQIEAEAQARFNRRFPELGQQQQILTLAAIEAGAVATSWPIDPARFFEMLVNTTAEGYYSDPQQGGNRDRISWVMTGFEDSASNE